MSMADSIPQLFLFLGAGSLLALVVGTLVLLVVVVLVVVIVGFLLLPEVVVSVVLVVLDIFAFFAMFMYVQARYLNFTKVDYTK